VADVTGPPDAVRRTSHSEIEVMGTVVTVDLYLDDRPVDVDRLVERARHRLVGADEVFSTWRADSPVSRLRRGEIGLGDVPAEVIEVLDRCAEARHLSDGWFDPWALPGGVDPTGYVKGWAAQRALGAVASPGVVGAVVNAAGDIASAGGPGGGRPFRFGIIDPSSPGRLAAVVEPPGALATSGTYERGAHLIDPFTGTPTSRTASASVTGPDLGLADALATAVAVAGSDGLDLVAAVDGYEALVIGTDGTTRATVGFPFAR
jgi:thiamine biosynthesis lipoprotein